MIAKALWIAATLTTLPAVAQTHSHNSTSPYAGQQSREIKALDAREIQSLRQGAGMGLAKAAELNGVPGPMHTLELATPLGLTSEQRASTRTLMDEHKARARAMGEAIVAAEAQLDRLFKTGGATELEVRSLTAHIAKLQGELRADHLVTHLQQAALLNERQRAEYSRLRGYVAMDSGAILNGDR
jgi:Spy/CpxP family protein refolding chaperone